MHERHVHFLDLVRTAGARRVEAVEDRAAVGQTRRHMCRQVRAQDRRRVRRSHQNRFPDRQRGKRPRLAFDQGANLRDDFVDLRGVGNAERLVALLVVFHDRVLERRLLRVDFDVRVPCVHHVDARIEEHPRNAAGVNGLRYDHAAELLLVLRRADENPRGVRLARRGAGHEIFRGLVAEIRKAGPFGGHRLFPSHRILTERREHGPRTGDRSGDHRQRHLPGCRSLLSGAAHEQWADPEYEADERDDGYVARQAGHAGQVVRRLHMCSVTS